MIFKKAKVILAITLPLLTQAASASDDFDHHEPNRGNSHLRPNQDSKMTNLNHLKQDIVVEDEDFWTRFLEDGFSFVPAPVPRPVPIRRPTFIPFVATPTKMPTMDGGKCDIMVRFNDFINVCRCLK